jgi:hypothetical protein
LQIVGGLWVPDLCVLLIADCVFYQLQIADCWCGWLQIVDFREKKGRNLAELAAAEGTQFSHLLSFFVVVVVVKFVSSDWLSSRSPTDLLEEEDR